MIDVKKLFTKILEKLAVLSVACTTTTVNINSTTGGVGTMYVIYDPVRRLVRLNGWYRNMTTASTSTAIFTLPAAYRPSEAKGGSGIIIAGSAVHAYTHDVTTGGAVRQRLTSNATAGHFTIEYTI